MSAVWNSANEAARRCRWMKQRDRDSTTRSIKRDDKRMRNREPVKETPKHGERHPAQGRRPLPRTNVEDTTRSGIPSEMMTPATMVIAIAIERLERKLREPEMEHPKRGPARDRRIEKAWDGLLTASQGSPGSLTTWFSDIAGASGKRRRHVRGSVEGTSSNGA